LPITFALLMPPRASLYPLHLSITSSYFPSKATNYEINIHIRITLDRAPKGVHVNFGKREFDASN
jgi:hypothetical protein